MDKKTKFPKFLSKKVLMLLIGFAVYIIAVNVFGEGTFVTNTVKSKLFLSTSNIATIICIALILVGVRIKKFMFTGVFVLLLILSLSPYIKMLLGGDEAIKTSLFAQIWNIIFIAVTVVLCLLLLFLFVRFIIKMSTPKDKKTREFLANDTLGRVDADSWEYAALAVDKDNGQLELSKYEKALVSGVCPYCGAKLIARMSKNKKEWLMGCENFPECKFTIDKRGYDIILTKSKNFK